jgi:hypothetical protein
MPEATGETRMSANHPFLTQLLITVLALLPLPAAAIEAATIPPAAPVVATPAATAKTVVKHRRRAKVARKAAPVAVAPR